jgi:hypothetical protein
MSREISLDDLTKRIEKLERTVFGGPNPQKDVRVEEFKGATGGLRLLLSQGFFDQRRTFAETKAELEKNGYNYSRQAVQTPLTRLSNVGGPLVSLTGKGRNAYAKRK